MKLKIGGKAGWAAGSSWAAESTGFLKRLCGGDGRWSESRRRLIAPLTIAFFSLTPATANEKSTPLEVGIIPIVSTHALFTAYQPLRRYFEQQLDRPVLLLTAANFKTFYEHTRDKGYDLVITPPHLARLAETESGYVPLATYTNGLQALLLVAKNSPITTVADLRGKNIGAPDALSLAPMAGRHWLLQRGLKAGIDYNMRITAPHNTAVLSVIRGETDAAIVGSGPYQFMTDELRNGVRVFATVGTVINAIFMAHATLPVRERERIRAALLSFANHADGKKFFMDNNLGGVKPLNSADLKTMDVYTKEAKSLLQAGK